MTERTLSLADLVLTKLQIHELTLKDTLDLAAMLAQHELSESGGREEIELPRIARVLAGDWGFWYTALTNLDATLRFIDREEADDDLCARARAQIALLRERMDSEPKQMKWRARAKVGPRMKWYDDVDSVERGGF